MKALKKSHAENFVAMCKDHFQAEMEIYMKHSNPVYDTLREVMDQNHKEHEKRLEVEC